MICLRCGRALDRPAGLLVAPLNDGIRAAHHLCVECFGIVIAFIEHPEDFFGDDGGWFDDDMMNVVDTPDIDSYANALGADTTEPRARRESNPQPDR